MAVMNEMAFSYPDDCPRKDIVVLLRPSKSENHGH